MLQQLVQVHRWLTAIAESCSPLQHQILHQRHGHPVSTICIRCSTIFCGGRGGEPARQVVFFLALSRQLPLEVVGSARCFGVGFPSPRRRRRASPAVTSSIVTSSPTAASLVPCFSTPRHHLHPRPSTWIFPCRSRFGHADPARASGRGWANGGAGPAPSASAPPPSLRWRRWQPAGRGRSACSEADITSCRPRRSCRTTA